ncbi:DUF4856 domain-containing protein [Gilvibacter sp. SZ-19]|uniref:DUF4856 domain-containing protein n=1 Tax=Gilvibacter sp. SZ-19 TaxID=754429 RepID=UPI000B3CE210|nr:DUF4856 domain-containing protein [Gilvibacter sp. SZ-19]ARV12851.1 DUF4856 domain-containing protein [Gilvibacter sp. SZ-19]
MKYIPNLILAATVLFASCSDDDNTEPIVDNGGVDIEAPLTYSFDRDGATTVAFDGQTTRIRMAEEVVEALLDFDNATAESLSAMYNHQEGESNFQDAALNASGKNLSSKTAASRDYFFANTAESAAIRAAFESYLEKQVTEVFPGELQAAEPGVAGQLADGSATRWVAPNGLEYNQLWIKGLIGALMTDQMINNYLSPAVLDEADNIENNDNEVVEDGKNYTTMEHKWDEAYGYLFGNSPSASNPLATLGDDDSFLNKYLGRVENDTDFAGIAQELFDAFKLGRAAIVGKNYQLRDEQAAIIQERISEIIAIRAVYYLEQGRLALEQENYGTAFHDLSEGYGFIYSLRFTRNTVTGAPYFNRTEVDAMLAQLMEQGPNGLWDVTPAILSDLAETIAAKFSFTVAQAAD